MWVIYGFLSVFCRREAIRQCREARKNRQERWDELAIAEKYDFNTVERYKLQKATSKEKALATAVEKERTAEKYNNYKRKSGYGGSSSSQRSPKRSPSPNKNSGSPRKSGGKGDYSRGGGSRPFTGRCNNCDCKGHMWRDCPERQ